MSNEEARRRIAAYKRAIASLPQESDIKARVDKMLAGLAQELAANPEAWQVFVAARVARIKATAVVTAHEYRITTNPQYFRTNFWN